MNRELSTSRLYSLGNFSNISFSHKISDIPEEVASNPEAIGLLQTLILIETEIAYKKYHLILQSIATASIEQALEILEEEKDETFKELTDRLNQSK